MTALPILALGLALGSMAPQEETEFYPLDYLSPPDGEVLEVGGMDFLPDGSLLVSTRRGRVWWIENPTADDPGGGPLSLVRGWLA